MGGKHWGRPASGHGAAQVVHSARVDATGAQGPGFSSPGKRLRFTVRTASSPGLSRRMVLTSHICLGMVTNLDSRDQTVAVRFNPSAAPLRRRRRTRTGIDGHGSRQTQSDSRRAAGE